MNSDKSEIEGAVAGKSGATTVAASGDNHPKSRFFLSVLCGCLLFTPKARAATHYVDLLNPAPAAPFTNWATAATTIQDAVDAAVQGDEIVVTNGLYATGGRAVDGTMTNRVVVDRAVVVRSVNGPLVTIIEGAPAPGTNALGDGAIRCALLGEQAVLCGFTLANGHTRCAGGFSREQWGGGARCGETAILTNCILVGNSAGSGGGVCFGTLKHCTLSGNRACWDGGGAWQATLLDCIVTNNTAGVSGGGVACGSLTNCTVHSNLAPDAPDYNLPADTNSPPGALSATRDTTAPAPGFQVRNWHVEDGLPDGNITALAQTGDGYLWVGTLKGLARYDGVRFVPIRGQGTNTLPVVPIGGLLAARDGTLWVAAGDRIGQLTNGLFRARYTPAAPARVGVPWYAFSPLAQDGEGTVWALAGTNSLLRFAGAEAPEVVRLEGLPPGPIKGLWSDHEGFLWAAKGVHACVYSQGCWKAVLLGPEPSRAGSLEGGAPVACRSRERGIWFTLARGWGKGFLRRRTAEGWEGPAVPSPLDGGGSRMQPSAVWEDRAGRLWGGRWWGGVWVQTEPGTWQRLQAEGPLAKSILTCLFEDREEGVWMGTIAEGLARVSRQPVTTLRLPSQFSSRLVNAVCAARDGTIWLGTGGWGLLGWQAGAWTQIAPRNDAEGNVLCVFEDTRGNLWAGASAGLLVLRGNQLARVPGVPEAVLGLHQDRAGRLWAAGLGGLVRSDDGTNWTELHPAGHDDLPFRNVVEDRQGRIWLGSSVGVWRAQGGQLAPAEFQKELGEVNIMSLLSDADGVLWFSPVNGGLFRWDGARLKHYTTEDGLPDDSIVSLSEDGAGNLWASSGNGIFGCARRSLAEYERGKGPLLLCWWLGPADGLLNRECSGGGQSAACRGPDGRIWVADMLGAVGFDPAAVSRGRPLPPLLFESLTADGVELAPAGAGFRARSSARRFEFRYTVPDFAAPGALRFRHQLEPLDAGWVEAGHSRVAVYSQLPPGGYRFRVMAGGSDGQWHQSSWSIALSVVPRFWERPWVRVSAAAFLLSAAVVLIASHQRRKLLRRLERLEMQQAVEKERARIARDLHDHLGASLTELVLMSDPQHPEFSQPLGVQPHLRRISDKARAMALTLSDTVWAVNPRNDNLSRLLDYLCAVSEELCESAGVRCWQDVPVGPPELPLRLAFRHGLVLAVREALNNALKHSGAKEIWLRLAIEPDRLRIQIEDRGRGFDVRAARQHGNGLANLRHRLAELGGEAEIQSAPGQGTTVRLAAPLEG